MLTKKLRVPQRDIKNVLKNGSKHYSPLFSLVFLPDKTLTGSQWLILVKKKNISKAVDRNRVKRTIGETVRNASLQVKTTGKGIFIINRPIDKNQNQQLRKEIIALFQKHGLL